jgi:hypothetical protein
MPELDSPTIERLAGEYFRSERRITLSELAYPYSVEELIRAFENLRRSIKRLLNGLTEDQINYNPDDNTYSISEVISHLISAQGITYNGFIDVSSSRRPHIDPVPRNPGGGAEKGLTALILQERLQKATDDLIRLLHEVTPEQIENEAKHPFFGSASGKGFMLFQLAHDLDHLKQTQAVRRSASFPSKRATVYPEK